MLESPSYAMAQDKNKDQAPERSMEARTGRDNQR